MGIKLLKIYLIAVLLGVITGTVASLLQWMIAKGDKLLALLFNSIPGETTYVGIIAGLISMIMVLCSWLLVRYFAPEASGSGVNEIEGTLLHQRPIFWRQLLPVKFISGVLALCAKMVLGREGPTIQIGGNLGKMLGELFKLSVNRTDSLIAAGSAAGLAAAFNAPLAGILFVMEEMRNQFSYSFTSFKIVVICCLMATITLHVWMGSGPSIPMVLFTLPSKGSLWLFLIFGVVIGFAGLLFNLCLMATLKRLDAMSFIQQMIWVLVVGFAIGYLSYVYPLSVGSGYDIISHTTMMPPISHMIGILIVVRFITTMLSYSTGVPGGIFAPMLALGSLMGLIMFKVASFFVHDFSIHPGMLALAGMSGLFAASVRSPITAVVLVVEMTQNYLLILPLMITCTMSTIVMQLAHNPPIYTQLLHRSLRLNVFRRYKSTYG